MDRIDEIRARCEAATPGPWYQSKDGETIWARINGFGDLKIADGMEHEDSAFVADVREDTHYLLTELAARDARIAELERERDTAIGGITKSCVTCANPNKDKCRMDAYYNQFARDCERWQYRGTEEDAT